MFDDFTTIDVAREIDSRNEREAELEDWVDAAADHDLGSED